MGSGTRKSGQIQGREEDVSKCTMGWQQGQCVMCGATLKVLTSLADQLLSSEETRVQGTRPV